MNCEVSCFTVIFFRGTGREIPTFRTTCGLIGLLSVTKRVLATSFSTRGSFLINGSDFMYGCDTITVSFLALIAWETSLTDEPNFSSTITRNSLFGSLNSCPLANISDITNPTEPLRKSLTSNNWVGLLSSTLLFTS